MNDDYIEKEEKNRIAEKKANRIEAIEKVNKVIEKQTKQAKQAKKEIKNIIKEWVLNNYEDPANSCPHDSKEGYTFIYGGPHDTRDILEYFFEGLDESNYSEETIEEIEKEIDDENGIFDWSDKP